MGIANIFRRAPDRLSAATANAVKPHHDLEHAISALRLAIEKDAQAAANAGASRVVAQAYQTLAGLQIQAAQGESALATLDELRRYPFGPAAAADVALDLAGTFLVGEDDLLTIVTWLSQVGRLPEVAPALRLAVDSRFSQSPLLIVALGDALAAGGDYAGAAARYRSLIDLAPEQGPGLLPRLRTIAEAAPSEPLAQETLGLVLFQQGNTAEAATHLATALALGDLPTPALLALADSYLDLERLAPLPPVLQRLLDQGEDDTALCRRCERALALSAAQPGELYRTIERICGDALRRLGRYTEAVDHYDGALAGLTSAGDDRLFAQSLVDRLADLARQVEGPEAAEALLVLGRARLLAGSAEGALAAYREAVAADRSAGPHAIAGLQDLVASAPALLSARLQLADLQLAAADWRGALDTLEAIRREMHVKRGVTVEPYRRLLEGVEAAGSSLIGHELLLAGALYGLAEELASPSPAEAVAYLARVLALLGPGHAESVLNRLDALGLLLGEPAAAHLLQGDAYLAKGDYAAALSAYLRAPLADDEQAADELCARLERLARADAERPEPLLAAADIRLRTGDVAAAVPLLSEAFARNPTRAAGPLVQRLSTQSAAGQCPPEGLALLATALLQLGDPASLEQAVQAAEALYEAGPEQAAEVAELCRGIILAEPSSAVYARAALLLGDALASLGQPDAAVEVWSGLAGHPEVAQALLIERLQALVEREPALTAAWLTLGDACMKGNEPAARTLAALTQALHTGAAGSAQAVWERLQLLDAQGPDLLRARLLEAEALAAFDTEDTPCPPEQAAGALHKTLTEFGAAAADAVERQAAQLPEGPAVWLLRGDVEATRREPVRAAAWLLQAVQAGQPHELTRAEASLRRLAQEHPDAPEPRLALAEALYRLDRLGDASRELGETAERYPQVRAQALTRLDEWAAGESVPGALWLAQAQGRIAAGDIAGALPALSAALGDSEALPEAHQRLRSLALDHPGQAGILRLLVWAEARLGREEVLQEVAGHAAAWLAAAPAEAAQVADALAHAVTALERLGLAQSDLALRIHLGWADALLAAEDIPAAAGRLQYILGAWPQAALQVGERCRGAAHDALRRLAAAAHIVRGELSQALTLGQEALAQGQADPAAWVEHDRAVAERAEPALAARAWAQAAAWQARRRDAESAAGAIRRAVALDPARLQPLAEWLPGLAWDDASRRHFLYTAAALLRDGGAATYAPALALYRALLDPNSAAAEAASVLRELAAFPAGYLPAWETRLDIAVQQGPPYPVAIEIMEGMLGQFGPTLAPQLLAACDRMDPQEEVVHRQRARIHEAAGNPEQAAAALLGLQAALPDRFPAVEQELLDLGARYADQPALRLYHADAYGQAGRWEEALALYLRAQEAAPDLAEPLVDRYRRVLGALPQSVAARWGLSRALQRLERPDEAAQVLDEISDLDAAEAPALAACLAELLDGAPECAWGWYVYGKLAFRQESWPAAIERLERSLQQGGVTGLALIRLHEMLGRAYWAQAAESATPDDDLDRALANLRRAVALSPDELALREAVLAVRREQLARAIAEKEQQAASGADPITARIELAALLGQRGEHNRAVALLQGMLAEGIESGRLRLALAEGFTAQGLLGLAATSLEAALHVGDLTPAERKDALYRLGQVRRRQLRYADALAALEELSALDAGYRQVLALIDCVQSEQARARSQAEPLYPAGDGLLPPEGR